MVAGVLYPGWCPKGGREPLLTVLNRSPKGGREPLLTVPREVLREPGEPLLTVLRWVLRRLRTTINSSEQGI